MKEELYTGLDIGSHSIKIIVAQQNRDNQLQVIGNAQLLSHGVSKGSVVSIEDAVTTLSQALEMVERMTGRPITRSTVAISGTHIITQESRGVIAVSRADGEVKEDDVERVIEAAQAVATPPNYEILHVIPLQFAVDNQTHIKDPVGMSGVRLEVVAQIILGLTGEIKNVTKTVFRTGLEIDDLVLGILATSENVLNQRQKELGVALVNIGASTTSVAVFEEGDILLSRVIPIGSSHITSDLAIGLRTSIEIAEHIKLGVGSVGEKIGKRDEVKLSDYSPSEKDVISRSNIQKMIEARIEEIFDHVNQALSRIGRAGRLPSGIVLTGGGAQLPGIVEYAKVHFRLPASLGVPMAVDSAIQKIHALEFTTAVGLAQWDRDWYNQNRGIKLPGPKDISGIAKRILSGLKRIFK